MKPPAYQVRETGGLEAAIAARVRNWRRRGRTVEQLREIIERNEKDLAELRQRAIDYCRRYAAEGPESISLLDQSHGEHAQERVRECMRDAGAAAFLLEELEHAKVIAFPGNKRASPAAPEDGTWLDLSGLSPYERGRIIAQAKALAEKAKERGQ